MDRWMLIAFKPTTYTGCHCHPDAHEEEFHILKNATKEQIIEAMGRYKFEHKRYEFTVFKNGLLIRTDSDYNTGAVNNEEYTPEEEAAFEAADLEVGEMIFKAEERVRMLTEAEEAAKVAEEIRKKAAQAQAEKDRELAELQRLQAKYK